MANRRLSMRKISEVLRLKWDQQLTHRQMAQSCSLSHSTVKEYLLRAQQAGLSWPLPAELDEAAIEHLLFPPAAISAPDKRKMPPMHDLYQDLHKKGVTLQLLWHEYKQVNPDGYQYSQFCRLYRQWVQKLDVCLRQEGGGAEVSGLDI